MIIECVGNPEHKTFRADATVREEWILDQRGDFVESLGWLATLEEPSAADQVFTCASCVKDAKILVDEH